jgi:hypothetical protein
MLRFVRLQRPLTGLAITYGTLVVTRWFAFRWMVPLPRILYFIFALVSSFAALTPYLLDRLFAVRIEGIANSLVFPATWMTIAGIAQIALFLPIRFTHRLRRCAQKPHGSSTLSARINHAKSFQMMQIVPQSTVGDR